MNASSARTVSIAMAFDERFAPMAAATIASLCAQAQAGRRYEICVLSDGIGGRYQELLSGMVRAYGEHLSLRLVSCNTEQFAGRSLAYSPLTRHTFTRLYLPQLLPEAERVLYLDSDLLISADVAALFDQDLQGHVLGCCVDPVALWPPERNMYLIRARGFPYDTLAQYVSGHLGLSGERALRGYFNSGVMLIDLPRYARALELRLPDLMRKEYAFPDQDILNVVFHDDYLVLDEGWNVAAGKRFRQWCEHHDCLPPITHYSGERKPWNKAPPLSAEDHEFWRAVSGTPFFSAALERWMIACMEFTATAVLQRIQRR